MFKCIKLSTTRTGIDLKFQVSVYLENANFLSLCQFNEYGIKSIFGVVIVGMFLVNNVVESVCSLFISFCLRLRVWHLQDILPFTLKNIWTCLLTLCWNGTNFTENCTHGFSYSSRPLSSPLANLVYRPVAIHWSQGFAFVRMLCISRPCSLKRHVPDRMAFKCTKLYRSAISDRRLRKVPISSNFSHSLTCQMVFFGSVCRQIS